MPYDALQIRSVRAGVSEDSGHILSFAVQRLGAYGRMA
jgi:hypothetical protein